MAVNMALSARVNRAPMPKKLSRILVVLVASLLASLDAASASAPVANQSSVAVAVPSSDVEDGGNFVFQLAGYVKDSLVRTVDGTKAMWSNYGRCNEIRDKQKKHRESLRQSWEMTMPGMTQREMRERLKREQGGISYDEFIFLRNGKEDRGKLFSMMFLMMGAPKYLPYAIMFYPDMLPSPFAQVPMGDDMTETLLEKKSRECAHALVSTMINLEKSAKVIPAAAKLNFFGRNKQKRQLRTMNQLGHNIGVMMTNPQMTGRKGAQLMLGALDKEIYFDEEPSRGATRLVSLPKPIAEGLCNAIDGPQFASFLLPNFMKRGKIVTRLQKITDADDFLVKEKVDLQSLSTARLLDACNDRLIGGPGRSDEEMRLLLGDWLDMAVVKPSERVEKSGQYYNGNAARAALIAYHVMEGSRDNRSASNLPRLLFKAKPEVSEEVEEPVGNDIKILPFTMRRKK